jgi:putative hemolysin
MVHVPAVGPLIPPGQACKTSEPHIIDTLIAERAPRLTGSAIWPLVRPALYKLLDYRKARRMAETICTIGGRAALDHVSDLLALKVEVQGLEHLPQTGRVIVVANHPTGIGDGVAVYDAIKARRPDVVFYANADAHRVCRRFDEVLIPVEWVEEKRSRERMRLTLTMTREAMEVERALMVFPAGRLAMEDETGRLTDPPWMTSAVSIARKYAAPIIPVHLTGPRSNLFHFFDKRWKEMRDITLFHELLNKQGRRFSLIVGAPIDPESLPDDTGEATEALKRYVERVLPTDPESRLT